VVFDPHRAGHELLYYPGETNMVMADIAVINKVDSADPAGVEQVRKNIEQYSPNAQIVLAESALIVENPDQIKGKRVLVVEDGPTLTHGEMAYGAGTIAAKRYEVAEIVAPVQYAFGSIKETYKRYPHVSSVLPAMGYGKKQIRDLENTINSADCDIVLFATPIDLPKLVSINKPTLRVRYEYQDYGTPLLKDVLSQKLKS
jgi:predicted GTPase